MSGNITEQVEVKIENECDPLHLPIQIKLEEENSLNVRKDLFAISTYEDLGIKEEPPVLGLEPDFPAYHQVDETISDNKSKSEHDGHSSQSSVEIVQTIERPKVPCSDYETTACFQVVNLKNVFNLTMKCRGCGFATTDKTEMQIHLRGARIVKCQLCQKEINNSIFAMHFQRCSSIKKKKTTKKIQETVLDNTGNNIEFGAEGSNIGNTKKVRCQVCHKEISEARFVMHSQTCSNVKTNSPLNKNKETVLEDTESKNKETGDINEDLQVQSNKRSKLSFTGYKTVGCLEVIDHKKVISYKMICRWCSFTTNVEAEIKKHVRNTKKVECQVCHKAICEESFAMHSQTCSSVKKTHPDVDSCSEKNKVTLLEDSGNKNNEIETVEINKDLQVDATKPVYKKRKTSVQPETPTHPSIQIEQVCNYNPTPNFTNPPSSVLICTSFEKIGSIVLINNVETFQSIKKCTSCEFKTEKMSEMLEHIKKSKTPKTSLKCPDCDNQFNTIIKLKSHLYNIHNIDVGRNVKLEIKNLLNKSQCHICNKQIKNSLTRHLYGAHNILNSRDISNDCYICTKQFDDITSLKSHLSKIHNITDTKPHCLTCGYKCTLRRGLIQHLKVKHKLNANRYKCNFCNQSFTQNRSYILHNRRKHKIRTHSMCHTCGLIFSNKKKCTCGHGTKKL